jgi:hypothetical protein
VDGGCEVECMYEEVRPVAAPSCALIGVTWGVVGKERRSRRSDLTGE